MFKRWNKLIHSSKTIYNFRSKYIMEPLKKIGALTPWHDKNAYTEYNKRRDETFRKWIPGSTVLEIGCGPFGMSGWFSKVYGSKIYVGVDYSSGMVKDAKLEYGNLDFVNADTLCLPFADKSFDVVYNQALFHHLKPEIRVQALLEQFRVARQALITEDVFGFEPGFWRWPHWAYYTLADGSYYRNTRREWLDILRSVNIRVAEYFYTSETTILNRFICIVAVPGEDGGDRVG